jgi:hypothetical protein
MEEKEECIQDLGSFGFVLEPFSSHFTTGRRQQNVKAAKYG